MEKVTGPILLYGTTMHMDVLEAIIGQEGIKEITSMEDCNIAAQLKHMKHSTFPAIIESESHFTPGKLITGLSEKSLEELNFYMNFPMGEKLIQKEMFAWIGNRTAGMFPIYGQRDEATIVNGVWDPKIEYSDASRKRAIDTAISARAESKKIRENTGLALAQSVSAYKALKKLNPTDVPAVKLGTP